MKKLLSLILLALALPVYATAPSLLGATSTIGSVDTGPTAWSVPTSVASGGTDSAAFLQLCKSGADNISSITWNGITMARVVAFAGASQCTGYLYTLVNPVPGNNKTLTINSTVGNNMAFTFFTLQNVLQSTSTLLEGYGQTNSGVNVTKQQYSTTTATASDLVLDWVAIGNGATAWTPLAHETSLSSFAHNGGDFFTGSDYFAATTTITNGVNMGGSWTTVKTDDLFVTSIKSDNLAVASVTPPKMQITNGTTIISNGTVIIQ